METSKAFDLGPALTSHYEESKRLGLSTAIDGLSKDYISEDLPDILEAIAGLPTESERELYINKFTEKTAISKRAVMRDLKALAQRDRALESESNVLILHPSYDSQPDFVFLGFKETVISNNRPEDRNLYILARQDEVKIHNHPVIEMGGIKIVVDERERILMNLRDRWGREDMLAFIANPLPPENVYHKVKDALKQCVGFQSDSQYGLVTAWIMATYFHRDFNAMPFLFLYGKKQCGKSRTLDVLERLSFNAMKVKGVSVPSMTDSIDGIRGTFIMDQAEILSQKQMLEMLGILADSYTPGGGKRRIVHITNKSRKVVEFETYSPKAFASIKEIDTDLKDRCIEIVMVRADKEYPYPEPFLPIWGELRNSLYRMALTKWQQVREVYQNAGLDMAQRVRELWRPIDTILILENVSNDEREAIRHTFLESMIETQDGLTETEDKLIRTILEMMKDRGEAVLTVQEIVDNMNLPEEERFKKRDQLRIVGKMINRLSLCMRRAGKESNSRNRYLFNTGHLENILKRYEMTGFNGLSATSHNTNGLGYADKETANGSTGVMPEKQHEDTTNQPMTADGEQSTGVSETADNPASSRYACKADDFIEEQSNFDGASNFCSMTPQDVNGLPAVSECNDQPVPRGNCLAFKMKVHPVTKMLEQFCTKHSAWCHIVSETPAS